MIKVTAAIPLPGDRETVPIASSSSLRLAFLQVMT
jgi:hypothetical protein